MKRNKRNTLIILLVSLVLIIACGFTFALGGAATKENINVFSPSEQIRARLTEPNWDAEDALKLVPGKTVRKDPMITNTSGVDEYAAIRLSFLYEDGEAMSEEDLQELLKWLSIDLNGKWVLYEGELTPSASQPLLFYYPDAIRPGQTSEPLFHSVRVADKYDSPALTEEALAFLEGISIFKIGIEGAVIQAEGFSGAADASAALKLLFPNS